MAVQTIYLLGTAAVTPNFWGNTQLNGSAPTAANSAYGWTPAKTAVTTPYYRGVLGATAISTIAAASASYNAGTSGPTPGTGTTSTTAGDSFIAGPFTGTFAATAWTFNYNLRTTTLGAIGHVNMRIWKSVNANGSSPTQLLANTAGATVTLSSTADVNSSISWSPGSLTLNNEYLFFQVEWQETTAGTSNNNSVLFRIGTASITTPDLALAPATGTLTVTQANQTLSSAGSVTVRGTLSATQANQTLSSYCLVLTPGQYVGSGDLVSGAIGWWGLRAYSAATAGTKCVNLRRDSDNATLDFNTLSNGNLDVASITTWKGSANLFVTKLYDQSGNVRDIAQATAANQPGLTLNGLLGSLPIIVFNGSQWLASTSVTINTPTTYSAVAEITDDSRASWVISGGNDDGFFWAQTGNGMYLMANGGPIVAALLVINTWYALQGMTGTTNSILYWNGNTNTGSVGTDNNNGATLVLGARTSAAQPLLGSLTEAGVWLSTFNSSQYVNVNNNQVAFWLTPTSITGALSVTQANQTLSSAGTVAVRGTLSVTEINDTLSATGTVVTPGVYTGPGDLISGATGWWGIRAYSAATAGTKCINLRRDSDQATLDFNTLSNGSLDVASITTWKGSANLFVTKLYDQSGFVNDAAQTTAANQPQFLLNAVGSLPGINYVNASALNLIIGSGFSISSSSPFTLSSFIKTTTLASYYLIFGANPGGPIGFEYDVTPTGNIRFTQQGVANIGISTGATGANSLAAASVSYDASGNWAIYVNGAASGSGVYVASITAQPYAIGASYSSYFYDGLIQESAAWGSILSSGNEAALASNQQSYWTATPPVTGTLTVTQSNQTLSSAGSVTVRGTLTVTQANQTLSSAGSVTVRGILTATQANETLSAAGSVTVNGTLSVTQANETLSAAGSITVRGTLSVTEVNDTLSATGNVPSAGINGTLAITQANQTLSSLGTVTVRGTLTTTQANQTLSATGTAPCVGTLTATQANQTLSAVGSVVVTGTLSATQANQTLSSVGSVVVRGTLTVTQANETLSAAGTLTVSGTLSAIQANETLSATGAVPYVGTLNITQAAQTISAAGSITVRGILNVTQANETLSAAGSVVIAGTLSATQANQTLSSIGRITVGGTLSVAQANETLSAAASTVILGTLSANQAAQTFSGSGSVLTGVGGGLNIAQAAQTLVAVGKVPYVGTLNITQAAQTISAAGSILVRGTLTATQSNQTIAATSSVIIQGILSTAQANQILSSAGKVAVSGALNVTQSNQTLSSVGLVTVRGTLNVTQSSQTLSATGSVLSGVVGTLNVIQNNQTLSASGFVTQAVIGTLHITQGNQTLSANALVLSGLTGTLHVTQDSQILSAHGLVLDILHGTLHVTQADQLFYGECVVGLAGWVSGELPWIPPQHEDLGYRAYREELKYVYQVSPLRRKGKGPDIKFTYSPPVLAPEPHTISTSTTSAWPSEQLPWTPPPNESLEQRIYQQKTKYSYQAGALVGSNSSKSMLKNLYRASPLIRQGSSIIGYTYRASPLARGPPSSSVIGYTYRAAVLAHAGRPVIGYTYRTSPMGHQGRGVVGSTYHAPVLGAPGRPITARNLQGRIYNATIVPGVARPIQAARLKHVASGGFGPPRFP